MSYDFYCYRPTSEQPDSQEALAAIQSEENQVYRNDSEAQAIKQKIAGALIAYNPRLEPFKFDYNEIARIMNLSVEQARAQWNHIELNPPEGDLAIQAQIQWDHVSFEIPYWYTAVKADEVFGQLAAYARVVRRTAGFFAYDPQTNHAFDPERETIESHDEYDRIVTNLPAIIAQGMKKKPWWRFWD
jgi:hypothetical protein